MNTKSLAKVKSDDESVKSTKSKRSIKLAEATTIPAISLNDSEESTSSDKHAIDQIGQLTRNLHDSLRELGYDKRLEEITSSVPEAQDKLSYVVSKTQQAAERALAAAETAMPIQEKLSEEAINLSEQWKKAFESNQTHPNNEVFKILLIDTLSYLNSVPQKTSATNEQLLEIMMAQDFQDLTGQVIKKITHMVQSLEKNLVQLLLIHVPVAAKESNVANEGLMNGPVINPEKESDVVRNQDQVDDLLASLGF